MKHTNTDWTFENIFGRLIVTSGKRGFVIAEVTNRGVAHFLGNEEEAIANAKLIAAAPDLLKAVSEAKTIVYNICNGMEPRSPEEIQAIFDTVIKKATE